MALDTLAGRNIQGQRHCRFPTTPRMLPRHPPVVWPAVYLADLLTLEYTVVLAQQCTVIGLQT